LVHVADPSAGLNNETFLGQNEYHFLANEDIDYGVADDGTIDTGHCSYGVDAQLEGEKMPIFSDLGQIGNFSELEEFRQSLRTVAKKKKIRLGCAGSKSKRCSGRGPLSGKVIVSHVFDIQSDFTNARRRWFFLLLIYGLHRLTAWKIRLNLTDPLELFAL